MTVEYLVPSANATNSGTAILVTNTYTLIDETVASADGSVNDTKVSAGVDGSDAIWALTDLVGFGTLNSATFRVRARLVNPGSGDTATYQFRLTIGGDTFDLTYDTATDENNGFTNYSTVLSGGASYPYTEAQFNAATVSLTQTASTKDMGWDNQYLDVDCFELEVDWSPAVTPRTVTCTPEDIAVTENDASVVTNVPRVVGCTPETIAVSTTTPSVDVYYFDESDDAGTGTDWVAPDRAFDDDQVNFSWANIPDANILFGGGTNAPATGDPISLVRARWKYSLGNYDSLKAEWFTDAKAESLGSDTTTTVGFETWSDFVALSAPAGGWTWAKVAALELEVTPVYTSGPGDVRVYYSEVEVTSDGPGATITRSRIVGCAPETIAARTSLEVAEIYYFDGTPVDDGAVWTDDANAADGSISTFAYTSTTGAFNTNTLDINAHSGPDTGGRITKVQGRFYGSVEGAGGDAKITCRWSGVGNPQARSIVAAAHVPDWTAWSGAFGSTWNNWAAIAGAKVKFYGEDGTGTLVEARAYRVEIEVTYDALGATITRGVGGSDRDVTCTPESIAVTENDAGVNASRIVVQVEPEVTTVTENVATVARVRNVGCTPETIAVTENDATIITAVNRVVGCTPETIAVTENDATIITAAPREVTCTPETIAVTENDAAVNASRNVVQTVLTVGSYSTFTAIDDTALSAYTPDVGNDWVEISTPLGDEPKISGNKLIATEALRDEWVFNSGISDGVLTVTVHIASGATSSANIVFRSLDDLDSEDHFTLNVNPGSFGIWRASSTDGGFDHGFNSSLGSNEDVTRYIKLVLNGTSIKLYVDDTLLLDVTDSINQTGTYHGVDFFGNNNNWIDDFKVVTGYDTKINVGETPAIINTSRIVSCTPETIAVTENDATIQTGVNRGVTCTPETIAVTENPATIITQVPRAVDCTPENILITENPATISTNVPLTVSCTPETIAIIENDAGVNASRIVVQVEPEVTTITESLAEVNRSRVVGCVPETIAVTESDATLVRSRGANCTPETILVTENPASIQTGFNRNVVCATEDILVTENQATIFTSVPLEVTCTSESILITENPATVNASRQVQGEIESILVSENQATVIRGVASTRRVIIVS